MSREIKRSWPGYMAMVAALHLIGITGLAAVSAGSPAFWSLGLLAYTMGMRHAFDIDHIAAIDNTVRKLEEQRRNPLGVGFYFSLGHSSVVFLLVLAVALSVQWTKQQLPQFQEIGGLIGTSVSGGFLLIIGLINLIILVQLFRLVGIMFRGGANAAELENLLNKRGFFARMIAPFYRMIGRSWHVYPLGFLFGLGFDTATEVGLLAISADAARGTVQITGILALPVLFAAGMSLLDTLDGMFMSKAYRWAFITPFRKLYYNITVTALSVMTALLIGGIELVQACADWFGLRGAFWSRVQSLDFAAWGYALAGLFVVAWAVSYGAWRLLKLDERMKPC